MDSEEYDSLSAFLYTIREYKLITAQVSISKGLAAFNYSSETAGGALASFDSDFAAFSVRLMLQRKYFQKGDALQLKKLLSLARERQVIVPNVDHPWKTETPQLISSDVWLICLTKRRGYWKVSGMTQGGNSAGLS